MAVPLNVSTSVARRDSLVLRAVAAVGLVLSLCGWLAVSLASE